MKTTIELACEVYGAHTEWSGAPLDRLEQLVALVRADERDKWMERAHIMILGEREACAKVCDEVNCEYDGEEVSASWVAAAIRNRGNI
jgi:hypothetical protein